MSYETGTCTHCGKPNTGISADNFGDTMYLDLLRVVPISGPMCGVCWEAWHRFARWHNSRAPLPE